MKVLVCDPVFLYGQGVFETMRTYDGKIFRLDDHLNRLIKGAKVLGLKLPAKETLKKIIQSSIIKKNAVNSRVKLIYWQAKDKTKSVVIITRLGLLPKHFTATISRIRQNENSPLCGVKSLNYLNLLLAKKYAQSKNFNEAIILNSKGFVCEGSFTNLFIVKNNCLFTPSLDSGCLPGVTRKVVLGLAKKNNIKVKKGKVMERMLFSCDEAFLTNSIVEIMPLVKIGQYKINKGIPGKLTRLLQEKYKLEIYKK